MAQRLEQRQQATVSHRMNFWAQPAGGTMVEWKYRGKHWLIKRPDDGSPPIRRTVDCEVCEKQLTYTVHSVKGGRRRQFRWRVCVYVSLAILLIGVAGLITIGGAGPVHIAVTVSALFLGFCAAMTFGQFASGELGITGHGASWPSATKHNITLIETRPDDRPPVVCPQCGHEEPYPWENGYKAKYVARKYDEAKARLAEHQCRAR